MRTLSMIGAVLSLMAVAGCNTVSSSDYAAVQNVMKTDPSFRRELLAQCIKKRGNISSSQSADMAALMGVPESRVAQTFCTRLYAGIQSGRLTHEDFNKAARGQSSPKIIRVLRG